MTDYEYLFAMTLQQKLKTKIVGRIFVRVTRYDELYVEIINVDGLTFKAQLVNFSEKLRNGYSTDYAVYEIIKEYKQFVMEHVMKKYFY